MENLHRRDIIGQIISTLKHLQQKNPGIKILRKQL